MLCQLAGGERSAGSLQAQSEQSQSALSQRLARLREDGHEATRRASQTIFYRLADPKAGRIIEILAELYCPPGKEKADHEL